MSTLTAKIQLRRDTSANWTSNNPILAAGEVAFTSDVFYTSTDQQRFKIGDGVQTWTQLDYVPEGGGGTSYPENLFLTVVNKTTDNLLASQYKVLKVITAQGQRLAVDYALADSDSNSADTIGVVYENINNNQQGRIISVGEITGINTTGSTQGENWTDGDPLYLSATTPGAITVVKPVAPDHGVRLGYVVYAHQNQGKIYVKIDNGYEIGELHDCYLPSPTHNQGIFWSSGTTRYENKSITTALGYTAENTSNKSIDGTLNSNSDTLYPSQKAVKTYVDGSVTGLLDDRGNYDASGDVFPSSGGSGTAGAILKGDLWYISVAGTLGGTSVVVGSSVRALVDTPSQTSSNWSILNVGLGYTPENSANKATSFSTVNNTLYPSVQAVKSYIDGIVTTNYIDTRYSTKYYVPYLNGESANQRILTTNTSTHAVPFLNIFNDIITNISIEITTAVASSSVRFQIYNGDKSTLLPTTLVMDSGLIASTTTGIKTISGLSLNLTLDNLYFMVISTNTNNVGVRGVPTYLMQQYYGSLTKFLLVSRSGTGYDYMGVSSAVPSTFNISGLVDTTPTSGIFAPTLFFR
jgi:hypothetical protein